MNLQPFIDAQGKGTVPVHYLFLAPRGTVKVEGIQLTDPRPPTYKVACMPYLAEIDPADCKALPFQRTEEPRAVTCPHCKASEEYQKCRRT